MGKYGKGYHGGSIKNNTGGNTQPKTGDHFTPLCRSSGYSRTMGAMGSGVRSGHQHVAKHYQYESAQVDDSANLIGWSPE